MRAVTPTLNRSPVIATSLVALLSSAVAFGQVSVGVVESTLKVRPTQAPGAMTSSANLVAAANEFEPFQIVVQGGAAGANAVMATASALTGPSGTLPASQVRLYRMGYVNVTTRSNVEGDTGLWPDPLVPDVDHLYGEQRNAFPFNVPAGQNRVIFVDVFVPRGTPAGAYSGTVTVTASGTGHVVPVQLTVLPFELPSTSSLPSTFGIGWNAACVAHHGSYNGCGQDAGIRAMNGLYTRFMLDHRITAEFVYTGPSASGAGFNWANTFDNHYSPLIEGTEQGLLLDGAKATSVRYRWTETQARFDAWAQHFRQKGWLDRTYHYTCDEPPATCAWSDIAPLAAQVHAADPQMRTLVTTNIHEVTTRGLVGAIDILVPVVNHMHDRGGSHGGNQRQKYDAFLAAGPTKELWWYQSCMSHGCGSMGGNNTVGWPSYMIDVSGTQNRAMEWLTFKYDIQGELYWDTTFMLNDAWNSQFAFGGNGDGTLLYPGRPSQIGGTTHIPVASYRLKMIREGMEDYEYLRKLHQLGDGAFARSIVDGLFPTAYAANQPAGRLHEARGLLASRLAALLAPEPTDPEPTDPEPTDPEPTDPEPTDPEPTDPEPTDPEPTDPEPTDPGRWEVSPLPDGRAPPLDVHDAPGQSLPRASIQGRSFGCSAAAGAGSAAAPALVGLVGLAFALRRKR